MNPSTSTKRPHQVFILALLAGTVLLSLLSFSCQTKQAPMQPVDLSGWWAFRFDPDNRGLTEKWYIETGNIGPDSIPVPGSFNQFFKDSLWYQGKVWYRKDFRVSAQWPQGRFYLRFLGVAIRSKIWLNGQQVGEHLFPYTGFELDVTKAVRPEAVNTLVVQVDNEILPASIPDTRWNGWWNFGGINRQVTFGVRPDVYTKDIAIVTIRDSASWRLNVKLATQNFADPVKGKIKIRVSDREGREIWRHELAKVLRRGLTRSEVTASIKEARPWSPDAPNLYDLTVETEAGSRYSKTVTFGFREIKVRGTNIFLNGKPIRIKGISRHELYPGSGSAVSKLRTEMDLEDIKKLGCNFLRLAHYPQHPYVYRLCDEMGLMVWSEIPAWKTRAEVLADSTVWATYGAPQLQEMIDEHRNHPSVVIWSVGNEFPSEKQEAAAYVKKAVDFVHRIDPTRLVTFASDRRERDVCFDYVDVIAINEYFGWYYGTIYDVGPALDKVHAKWPSKPIIVSEVGCGSVLGWRNPNPPDAGRDYSEDYQLKYLRTHLRQIYDPGRAGFVSGAVIWNYADFPDPHRIGGGHPPFANYVNCKGLVTQDRRKKLAFDLVRELFRTIK